MDIAKGDKYFSANKKEYYRIKKKYCRKDNRTYSNCLKKNKIKITSLHDEEMAIKEGIRDNNESIEYLECAMICCDYHACSHIFVFTDNPNRKENLPCFCVKCGLILSYILYPGRKGMLTSDNLIPSAYYLSKIGVTRENIMEYIGMFNSLGYLPVSKDYIIRRYKFAVRDFPNATDDEHVRHIIRTVTGEKQLTR